MANTQIVAQRGFTNLKDVKPFKTRWRVDVKVLHVWRSNTLHAGEMLEMIFADAKGAKIHATCKKTYMKRVERHLNVGEWKVIENFSLTQASGKYRATDHVYKMGFVHDTSITISDSRSDEFFLDLKSFDSVSRLDTNFLIDVLGQVVDLGPLETKQVHGEDRKRLVFQLKDANGNKMACCLWGNFADTVFMACEKANDSSVICLIRFAKINFYRGQIQITNAFDTSAVLINPSLPEVEELKKLLPENGLELALIEPKDHKLSINSKQEKWSEKPVKSISELLMAAEVEKCIINATVKSIDMDWAWYYWCHKGCNKKCETQVGDKPLFRCTTCLENVSDVELRYKLHLVVKDDTDKTKLMLLDSIAQGIVGKPVTEIHNGSFQEIEDPEASLPDDLKALVGKTFSWAVDVKKDNVFYGVDSYKCDKVWPVGEIDSVSELSSKVDPMSSLFSGDELSLMDNTSQGTSEAFSTPSSKRKVEPIESVPDLTSTTKKQCKKVIKLENGTQELMNIPNDDQKVYEYGKDQSSTSVKKLKKVIKVEKNNDESEKDPVNAKE